MIRQPLNVIPTWVVQILQTGVALKRISVYLDEDEVTEQVSSLKKTRSEPLLPGADEGLGLENATLKWNEVVEVVDPKDAKKDKKGKRNSASGTASPSGSSDTDTVVDDTLSVTPSEAGDRKFELKDVSIMFPEGELTLVTGPTASGKTALLVRHGFTSHSSF